MKENQVPESKLILRKRMLSDRSKMSADQQLKASNEICQQLIEHVEIKKAKVVHAFLPMNNEVQITPFIEWCLSQQIKVICPKSLKKPNLKHLVFNSMEEVEKGVFGTTYPAGDNEFVGNIDLIIVPGLAFDENGGRLGYGGGYYDKFLSEHAASYKVGIGFTFQLVSQVPRELHDVLLDEVIVA